MKAGKPVTRVLFVCLGNICRSPTAHGVFASLVENGGLAEYIEVDSCGTGGWHVGEPPDGRSQAHATRRGYDLSAQRARQLVAQDFTAFDLVLVMDGSNERAARALCPPAQRHKLRRLTEFCSRHRDAEVPDPYYGGADGFAKVYEMLVASCAGLLDGLA